MHIHKWSKWSEPFTTRRLYADDPALVQNKSCDKCGIVQQRFVGNPPFDKATASK